eukprot:gene10351-biopygen10233
MTTAEIIPSTNKLALMGSRGGRAAAASPTPLIVAGVGIALPTAWLSHMPRSRAASANAGTAPRPPSRSRHLPLLGSVDARRGWGVAAHSAAAFWCAATLPQRRRPAPARRGSVAGAADGRLTQLPARAGIRGARRAPDLPGIWPTARYADLAKLMGVVNTFLRNRAKKRWWDGRFAGDTARARRDARARSGEASWMGKGAAGAVPNRIDAPTPPMGRANESVGTAVRPPSKSESEAKSEAMAGRGGERRGVGRGGLVTAARHQLGSLVVRRYCAREVQLRRIEQRWAVQKGRTSMEARWQTCLEHTSRISWQCECFAITSRQQVRSIPVRALESDADPTWCAVGIPSAQRPAGWSSAARPGGRFDGVLYVAELVGDLVAEPLPLQRQLLRLQL